MSLDSGGFSSKNKKGVQPFKTDLVENKLEHRRKRTSLIKGKDANQPPTSLSRPVGNAIKNVSPNDSVYQNHKKINSFDKKEDPANFILRLKSLEKAVPTYDLAESSNDIILENSGKINTFLK